MMTSAPSQSIGLRIALVVAAAYFMENLDATVIVTALPQIGQTFGIRATDLSLSVTAYLLAGAAFIATSSWVSDRFGSRTVFVGAILLFTLASLLCGVAPDFWTFIAARVLQGASAALMSPVGRLVVLRTTPKAQLVRAIATLTWPALIAPVLGPAVGGLITTYASWRWIFILNLPLGVAGAVLALRYVPQQKSETGIPFDWTGFVLTAAGLAGVVYGLDLLSQREANLALAVGTMVAGAGVVMAAVRHARRTDHALVDLRALSVRSFVLSTLTSGALFRVTISATPFLLPLMFQIAFKMTPISAGLLVLVYMSGNLLMKTATTSIMKRFGFRSVLIFSGFSNGAAILGCGLLSPMTPMPALLAVLFAAGAMRSLTFTACNTLAFAEVPPDRRGGATILWGVTQQVAFSLGVACAAVFLNLSLSLRGAPHLTLEDFRFAFALMAAVALASGFWFYVLSPATGADVSGHRRYATEGESA